jgi:hypothetical protein
VNRETAEQLALSESRATERQLVAESEAQSWQQRAEHYEKALKAIIVVLDDENIPDFNASNRAEEIARRALLGD